VLDTDTYCLHAFPEVFDLLDRFDLAAAHEAGGIATRWVDARRSSGRPTMPECFPELNTGVIAFRRGANVLKLLERWLVLAEGPERRQPGTRKISRHSAAPSTNPTRGSRSCRQSTIFVWSSPASRAA
jgi:hypothetical protein